MFFIAGLRDVKTRVKNGLEARRYCDRCGFLSDMLEQRWRKYAISTWSFVLTANGWV
jgi:hypothetical protein